MADAPYVIAAKAGDWADTEPGVRRRVMTVLPELILVEVAFEAGEVGSFHAHPHLQASYVTAGRFEVTIDGRRQESGTGGRFIGPEGTGAWRQGAGGQVADRRLHAARRQVPRLGGVETDGTIARPWKLDQQPIKECRR